MAKRKQPKLTQYQIKTEPPYRFLTEVPRFEWRTPWSTPPTQMGAKNKQFGAAHIAGIGITIPPTEFIKAVPKFEWRQPWSVPPTRMGPISRMVGAALIAATGLFAPVFTPPATTLDMDWLTPLSTPTPAKCGLPTHQQQTIAFTPENFPSCGLVGVDTEGTALVGGSSVNTIDYTGIRVGGGQNRALVAMIQTDTNTTGMAAVWDQGGTNQSMATIGTSVGSSQTIAIFGLRNPVSGNKTLRITWATAGFPTVSAVSLITVDQSSDANAFKNYRSNTGNVSSLSVTVPSKPGDIVVGIGCVPGPTVTAVGDNSIYIDNTSVGNSSGAGWNVGASSVTFTGTSDVSGNWLLGAIDVSANPCPVDTDFILPLSEPPKLKAALHPSLQDATADVYSTTAPVVEIDTWFSAFAEPTNTIRIQTVQRFGFTAASTESIGPDKWLRPLSEPVRVQSRFSALQQPYVIGYVPDSFDQWFNPLSEPTQRPSFIAPDQSGTPFVTTEVVTIDKWFDALSEPTRTKLGLNAALQAAYTTEYFPNAPNANVGLWLGSFAEPVRAQSRFSALQTVFTIGYSPETIGQWFNPLSEPARIKRSLNAPNQSWVPFVTTETVTVDKWFDAFSEPVRVTSRFSALQQAYTSGYVSFEVVTVDKWFDPLSEPVRIKPTLRTALQPAATQSAKLFPDPANFLEGWSSGLAEPVRQKLGLNTALQSVYTTGYFSFEIITVDKWYAALSDPKRFRPALHVSLQQTLTQDTVFIPNPSRYEGWYGALSEPQRQQVGLKAAQQTPYASAYVTPEVVTVDKWFEQLSDPTRLKPGDRDRYSGENEWTAIAASMKWFSPLTEPVRQKIGLSANQQQTLAYAVSFTAEVVSVDKWFVSYSEPVRFKRGQRPELQQVSAQDPRYIPNPANFIEGWFKSYAEPIRVPARLVTAAQQAFFYGTITPEIRFDYYTWLTEPVRQKKGLGAHLQRPFTQDLKLFPNPARFLEGWYNWFSAPVRKLPQLNAALQQSFTTSDRRPVLAAVTVTMAATEVNNDVALFAIKVLPYNPPATAVVSLTEIGHGASLTSIVEEGDDGSGTSVVES